MTAGQRASRRRGLMLVAPALVVLGLLTGYPGLYVLWLSLQHRIPVFGVAEFAGFGHYVFLVQDPRFWSAVQTTALFTTVSVLLELLLGVLVALALQARPRGRRLGLSLLLLAWAMPAVVTAKLFEWLYHPSAGLINVALAGRAINWLGDPDLALPAVILADVWRTMPFVAILAYARLLTVPAELYEAAQMDGAGRLGTLRHITLPLLRQVVMIAVLFRTLDAVRAFDIMYVLTGGGPANTTETLTVYAYRSLFQMLQVGFGSAIGVIVFGLVMMVAWAYLRLLRREGLVT
jgi:multiple sugar transport system permease protein